MVRPWLTLALITSSAFAQSRVDLLQRVGQHYATADSFDVKGTVLAPLPGSSLGVRVTVLRLRAYSPNFFLMICMLRR